MRERNEGWKTRILITKRKETNETFHLFDVCLYCGSNIVHGKDVQIEGEMSKPSTPVPTPTPSPAPGAKAASSGASTPTAAPGAVNTTTLEDTVELQASAHDIYDVLLNQAKVQIWTRSNKSTIVAKVGTKFSLFGGSVTGEIKELVEDKKIVQSWRQSSWPAGTFDRFDHL